MPMERVGIRAEERTGLIVAVVLHVALLAILIVQGLFPAPAIDPPQRMTVSLAEDVGMEATAPDPVTESRASTAPTMDVNPAPAPEQQQPAPPQVERPVPAPQPQRETRAPSPQPRTEAPRARRPEPQRTQPQAQPPRAQPQPQPQRQTSQRSGGSRLGDNFLEGAGEPHKRNASPGIANRCQHEGFAVSGCRPTASATLAAAERSRCRKDCHQGTLQPQSGRFAGRCPERRRAARCHRHQPRSGRPTWRASCKSRSIGCTLRSASRVL